MTRLYVSDLDGTLLDPAAQLRPASRDGLHRILDAGVHFTIATARSRTSMHQLLGDVPISLPVVEFNGAFVSDYATGEHLVVRSLTENAAADSVQVARDRGYTPFVSTTGGGEDHLYISGCANDGMRAYLDGRRETRDPRLREVKDIDVALDEQVVCVSIISREDSCAGFAAEIRERHGDAATVAMFKDAYFSGWCWVTVMAAGANKREGVHDMIRISGLHDHEVVAFGDTHGDLPLFEAAHRRVAVDNAEDALHAAATHRIGPNTEDSVIDYILLDAGLS